ncbi:hypothetical protein BKM30_07490 [Pseudomonas syringae pv. syringae]|nr:hypothetical protein BKM10_11180 [Pseudomonas syringae pv. syringae]POR70300.1 hypothetical protein BKM27_10710 [Pseudomonas syringae pv. syringae]POR79539.1 hypothetical protein BKM30_07490 [Pseudomonas syringae pv. syringae]
MLPSAWLYLAVVLDLFSRQVIGWSIDAKLMTSVREDCLYCLYVGSHDQDFCSKRAPATRGRTLFDIFVQRQMLDSLRAGAGCCWSLYG